MRKITAKAPSFVHKAYARGEEIFESLFLAYQKSNGKETPEVKHHKHNLSCIRKRINARGFEV